MIRYRLDDLGWYQFEWLVQAVLKDHLGIGIESWGGHGDHGRDVQGRADEPLLGNIDQCGRAAVRRIARPGR